MAAANDFSEFSELNTIVDAGGGTANRLTTIRDQYPDPEGALFELPRVVRDAPELIESRGLEVCLFQ